MKKISGFLTEDNRIKAWPSKKEGKLQLLVFLAKSFDPARTYTEQEVNALLTEKMDTSAFNDVFLLRRGLIEAGLLERLRDGSKYWRPKANDDSPGPDSLTEPGKL